MIAYIMPGFATTLGLTAVALTNNPAFPTYPNPMSTAQVSAGLSAAFAATTILGTGGAVALLIVLFMVSSSQDKVNRDANVYTGSHIMRICRANCSIFDPYLRYL